MAIQSRGSIHGYELLERIGSGGFGAVYRAYQSTIGRQVAVKIILPAYANHPQFIRLFEREAQLISRLEHIHIVPLYDYWRDPDGAYIVMRWMRGGTLANTLRKSPFDLQSASLLLDQVASGLAAAHNQHIIHRDLKPSNILLDEEGNAYLGDFGIAMDLRGSNGSVGDFGDFSTTTGKTFGSFGYMSPEQLHEQDATLRSDIYSLGITLYEVLTGRHPFPAQNSVQQLFKQIDESLPLIQNLDQEVLDGINQVIQKATAKNPERRYQDALAFAAAFNKAAGVNRNGQPDRLVESLTLREQEILHLLIEGYSNRQIAHKLFVELPTIKWHISNIYKKLGVRTRVQAIVRARELDLIVSAPGLEQESKESTPSAANIPEPVNPYKGLRSFEPADNRDFFGRETIIERLLQKLTSSTHHSGTNNQAEGRFLVIVGPSGSGKSSLVKAGIIPALWSGRLPGSEKWFVINMVPGARPMDNLETSLTRIAADQAGNIRGHLDRDGFGLLRISDLILPEDDSELLVIIDQFEQLFTLVEDESTRSRFMELIEQAVTDLHSRVRVIITLRADFYDRPLQYPNFGRLVQLNLETLLPLKAEEIERAVVKPAQQVGVSLESGLAASIIEDVNYRPGSLPLLQYALTELFDHRNGRLLTNQAFLGIGRVGGALANRAEKLFKEQDDLGREMIRQMFLRLVNVSESPGESSAGGQKDPGTGRRVLQSELLSATYEPDQLDDIIESFVDYRLLTLDQDPATRKPTIELAHEAILGAWDRLRIWVEQSTDDLRIQRQLINATNEWIAGGKDESFLLRGARLASTESWVGSSHLALTGEEQEYITTSIAAHEGRAALERQRQEEQARLEQKSNWRLKALVAIMAIALLITTGLTVAAISFARRAESQKRFAERQQRLGLARELSAAALANLDSSPERSMLLALKAAETTHEEDGIILPEVERILHQAVQADRTEITIPMAGFVTFSPDGETLAIGDSNGAIRLWDSVTGQEIHNLEGHRSLISDLVFSPDGRFLVSASFDKLVKIWDVTSGIQVGVIQEFNDQVRSAAFSPDGRWLATVEEKGPLRIWDLTALNEPYSYESSMLEITDAVYNKPLTAQAIQVVFTPNGDRIAVSIPNKGIYVWDVASGELSLEIPRESALPTNIAFSPDGKYLASGSGDLETVIVNAETGEQITSFPETAPITTVAFSQDGQTLATSSRDGMVSLWDMGSETQKFRILGQPTGFNFLALSPDGTRVAVGSDPHSTSIWDVSSTGSREVLTIAAHEGKVHDAIYDPTGRMIASTGEDGSLRVWDAATGDLLQDLPAQADWFHFPSFSPDGNKLAAANEQGGISIWDVHTGQEILAIANDGPALTAITFSPDGTRIAAGGLGGFAYIWDAATGQQLTSIKNNEGLIITELNFSPHGEYIFTYDWQGWFLSWDSNTGELVSGAGPNPVCEATLWDAELSAGGQLQAVAAFDGLAYVFRAVNQPGEQPQYASVLGLTGHEGNVTGVAFNEQGTILATSGFDGTVRLWDLEWGEMQTDPNPSEALSILTDQSLPLEGVDFSPDGRYVVSAGEDGLVRVFTVTIEELMALARSRLSRGFTEEECQAYLHKPSCGEN